MSEEFNITITFKSEDDEVISFLKSFDEAFNETSHDKMEGILASSPVDLNTDEVKKLVPKKFKKSLGYALAETALECEPNLFAGQNYELSKLKKNNKEKFVISADGMDYDGQLFCKYLVTLIFCLQVQDLTAEASGEGWEANWILKNGKLSMKKEEFEV